MGTVITKTLLSPRRLLRVPAVQCQVRMGQTFLVLQSRIGGTQSEYRLARRWLEAVALKHGNVVLRDECKVIPTAGCELVQPKSVMEYPHACLG